MPSTIRRFPLDDLLRRHGWQIAGRPRGGEATWQRRGEVLAQSEALATLPKEQVEAARAAFDGYGPADAA